MLKREPYIDALVGPQSYHNVHKILLAFNAGSSNDLIENNINGYVIEKYDNEDFMMSGHG